MIIVNAPQGSPEWHRARLGVVTASAVDQILTGGGEPKMPKCYGLTDDAPREVKRAPAQTAILQRAHKAGYVLSHEIQSLSALSQLVSPRRRYLVEIEAPEGVEPVAPPITLSKQRRAYMNRLLHEWATGTSAEEFGGTKWTEHGHHCEGEAADYIAMHLGCDIKPVGFVYRDDSHTAGCSPDAFIEQAPGTDDDELCGVELKCPAGWTHIEYLRAGVLPQRYVPQVQFGLWVTGFSRWYFMSYAAPLEGVPWAQGAYLPPLLVEVEPDPRWQDAFSEHVPAFVTEMMVERERLLAMGVRPAAKTEGMAA